MKNIKKNKDKRILLLVLSFGFILILLGILGYFLSKNQTKEIETVINDSIPTITSIVTKKDITPTEPIKSIDPTNQAGLYTFLVEDDTKNEIVNLILKKDNKEIIIDKIDYYKLENETVKGTFSEFLISSNNKYFHYIAFSGLDFFESRLYDITNQKITRVNIPSLDRGFTSDNAYFYGCSEDGMADGGVIVYRLSNMEIVYQKPNGLMKCKYNSQNNTLSIDYSDNTSTDAVYSFDSNKIISQ